MVDSTRIGYFSMTVGRDNLALTKMLRKILPVIFCKNIKAYLKR